MCARGVEQVLAPPLAPRGHGCVGVWVCVGGYPIHVENECTDTHRPIRVAVYAIPSSCPLPPLPPILPPTPPLQVWPTADVPH